MTTILTQRGTSQQISQLECTSLSNNDRGVLIATKGLQQYRVGSAEEGRKLYDEARRKFSGHARNDLVALSKILQAEEEIKINRLAMLDQAENAAPQLTIRKEIEYFSKLQRSKHNGEKTV